MPRPGVVRALLIGMALAASLAFGLIPAVMQLYAARRGVAGVIDARLVDLASAVLNAALLVALIVIGGRRTHDEHEERL